MLRTGAKRLSAGSYKRLLHTSQTYMYTTGAELVHDISYLGPHLPAPVCLPLPALCTCDCAHPAASSQRASRQCHSTTPHIHVAHSAPVAVRTLHHRYMPHVRTQPRAACSCPTRPPAAQLLGPPDPPGSRPRQAAPLPACRQLAQACVCARLLQLSGSSCSSELREALLPEDLHA